MDYLARESAPFSQEFWGELDSAVIAAAKKQLVGRRFLHLFGPLGAGANSVTVDSVAKSEELEDGMGYITGRRVVELPQLFEDFTLLWRDLESSEKDGFPYDFSAAAAAAQRNARKEDELIFWGNAKLGMEGLMNASGACKIARGDWKQGENAFADVAKGVMTFSEKGVLGSYSLVVSPDVYVEMQRIQPSMGVMEIDRISKLVDGRLFRAPVLGAGKAVLVCAEPQYMDLALGADLGVGYLELKDFNHVFRILETAALRIKNSEAIVVFE